MDLQTGYRTKSMLTMPVMCADQIVAVAQLVNKIDYDRVVGYDREDEDTFLAFAVYAGVCIRTSMLYTNAEQQRANSDLLLQLTRTLQVPPPPGKY